MLAGSSSHWETRGHADASPVRASGDEGALVFDLAHHEHRMRGMAAEIDVTNDRSGDRTHDLKIKSLLLYQLSYPVGVCRSARRP